MIVGIDLGTTNSLVAYFTEEGPKIIPNRLGRNLTPSVVSVDGEGNVYVGETARERMSLYPDTVAQTFKRNMGTERDYVLSGRHFRPEELSSLVLRSLKEDAESYLGEEVTEAVISVPAYFDDKRRKATMRAGELAGLKGERMISEPTASMTKNRTPVSWCLTWVGALLTFPFWSCTTISWRCAPWQGTTTWAVRILQK